MPRALVTLCTYNERENLSALVPEIRRTLPDADVLVIDDGSPDGTGALADELSASDPRIRVLHRAGKLGLGSAILAGLRRAIADGYDFVINMDADFSHDPSHLPALLACMERADVAIGSRYVPGGGIEGWGALRHFMSQGINWYARLLLGLSTRDNSGAYRCYRCSKLRQIDLDRVRARGYAFQEEILFHCRLAGCRFAETPIIFHDRRYGTSKINWRESAAALWIILWLGAGNACGFFSHKCKNSQREANSDVGD
jgi:dolichol-phosphate mannosyltransferase